MTRSLVVCWALALGGCGVPTASSTSLDFDSSPSESVTSARGFEVRLFERANAMVRGQNTVRIERSEPTDSLELVPWMPAMGHGSSVVPVVDADGEAFVVSQLVLTMPGTWELRCAFGEDDHATFEVRVP